MLNNLKKVLFAFCLVSSISIYASFSLPASKMMSFGHYPGEKDFAFYFSYPHKMLEIPNVLLESMLFIIALSNEKPVVNLFIQEVLAKRLVKLTREYNSYMAKIVLFWQKNKDKLASQKLREESYLHLRKISNCLVEENELVEKIRLDFAPYTQSIAPHLKEKGEKSIEKIRELQNLLIRNRDLVRSLYRQAFYSSF